MVTKRWRSSWKLEKEKMERKCKSLCLQSCPKESYLSSRNVHLNFTYLDRKWVCLAFRSWKDLKLFSSLDSGSKPSTQGSHRSWVSMEKRIRWGVNIDMLDFLWIWLFNCWVCSFGMWISHLLFDQHESVPKGWKSLIKLSFCTTEGMIDHLGISREYPLYSPLMG